MQSRREENGDRADLGFVTPPLLLVTVPPPPPPPLDGVFDFLCFILNPPPTRDGLLFVFVMSSAVVRNSSFLAVVSSFNIPYNQ